MNFNLNEKETRELLTYRMRHEWFEKHKRLGVFMVWWLMVVGVILVILVLVFRAQVKAWTPNESLTVGVPVMVATFWPAAVLYWQEICFQIAAKKQAKAMFNQAPAEVR